MKVSILDEHGEPIFVQEGSVVKIKHGTIEVWISPDPCDNERYLAIRGLENLDISILPPHDPPLVGGSVLIRHP